MTAYDQPWYSRKRILVVGHSRKVCVPPAVICEHSLRVSCEPKKIFSGQLRAALTSAQIRITLAISSEYLRVTWGHLRTGDSQVTAGRCLLLP